MVCSCHRDNQTNKGEAMKCILTGGNGMLGTEIKKVFKIEPHDFFCTDKDTLDVSDRNAVFSYAKYLPKLDYIIHLAAETDLEFCEKNPAQAYFVNMLGTCHISELASMLDVPMIYISTAGIFNGVDHLYQERSSPNPKNHYGMSKLRGEYYLNALEKKYIFRMSWAMGGGPDVDKKFVNKVIKLIRAGAKTIYGITDIYGSPTYTKDVALTIKACLEDKIPFGVYHTAGIGSASRFDVAKAIIDILRFDVELIPVTSEEFGKLNPDFPCPRAHNETIISTKDFPSKMRPWKESLYEYLTEHYE